MSNVSLHINDHLVIDYIQQKISTDNVSVNSNSSYNEYEKQNKKYIFDPIDTGEYEIVDSDGNSLTVDVYSEPDGIVHQWDISEGSGSSVYDKVGSVNGSISNASWVSDSQSKGNYKIYFDGSSDGNSDYIDFSTVPSSISGNPSSSNFTIAVTIEDIPSMNSGGCIWQWYDGSNTYTLSIDNNGRLGFGHKQTAGYGTAVDKSKLSSGKKRVQAVIDSGTFRIAIDGTEYSDNFSPKDVGSSPGDMRMGATQDIIRDSQSIQTYIDNPTVYDSSLSISELDDDYKSQPWT